MGFALSKSPRNAKRHKRKVEDDAALINSGCSLALSLDLAEGSTLPPTFQAEPVSDQASVARVSLSSVHSLDLHQGYHQPCMAQPLYLFYEVREGKLQRFKPKSGGMASGPFTSSDPSDIQRVYITGPAHIFLNSNEQEIARPELMEKVNKDITCGHSRLRFHSDRDERKFYLVPRVWVCFDPSLSMDWFIGEVDGEVKSKYGSGALDQMSRVNLDGSSVSLIKRKFIETEEEVDALRADECMLFSTSGLKLRLETSAQCRLSGSEYSAEHMLKLRVLCGKPLASMSGSTVFYRDEQEDFCDLLGQLTGTDSEDIDGCCVDYVFVLPFYHLIRVIMRENENAFPSKMLKIPNDNDTRRRRPTAIQPSGECDFPVPASLIDSHSSGYGSSATDSRNY